MGSWWCQERQGQPSYSRMQGTKLHHLPEDITREQFVQTWSFSCSKDTVAVAAFIKDLRYVKYPFHVDDYISVGL